MLYMKKSVFIVLTALCITGCGAAGTDVAHSGDDTLSAVDKVLQMMMEPQGFVGKTVRMVSQILTS